MKNIQLKQWGKAIFLALVIFGAQAATAQKAMDQFKIQVDGLGCPFCAYGLEKKFKEFKGIKQVAIDIETGNFTFEYPAEKALTLEAVVKQVEKAGYTPVTTMITRADGQVEESGGELASGNSGSMDNGETVASQATLKVAGNCEMCQARIEKAAKSIAGVTAASWDKKTKILTLDWTGKENPLDQVSQQIAAVGHDTEKHKAAQETYEGLPACCYYERIQD
ncbi:Copper chaperone CopZ [Robiginitalea myxolifaciens]|uniref:Copper chaperone CopZ n=1 Tax=Robiginitalea myxolifaciens TaxID=400055 RepID=A0A1I6FMY6_9FLAO|nr:cation transporter [Robiginitalea myxolifaciens]SFR31301.1 Copper chaperone CopZ [Robiginitalea myxolifaciens]